MAEDETKRGAFNSQVRLRERGWRVEFIPADDEKGPGLRLKHKIRGKRGQAAQV